MCATERWEETLSVAKIGAWHQLQGLPGTTLNQASAMHFSGVSMDFCSDSPRPQKSGNFPNTKYYGLKISNYNLAICPWQGVSTRCIYSQPPDKTSETDFGFASGHQRTNWNPNSFSLFSRWIDFKQMNCFVGNQSKRVNVWFVRFVCLPLE